MLQVSCPTQYMRKCQRCFVLWYTVLALQQHKLPRLAMQRLSHSQLEMSASKYGSVVLPLPAGVTELSYSSMGKVVAHEVAKLLSGQPPTVQLNQVADRPLATQSIGL